MIGTMILIPAALLAPGCTTCATPEERPNVILVMTDDQGYGDLGVHGNPVLKTPNLDRLANEGVRLSDFYVHPVCAPTRASLMTGRWCQRTTAIDTYRGRAMMEPEEITIAELLADAGYATGIFGKWHLGDCHPTRAIDQGFQTALVHRGGGIGQPSDPVGGEGRYTNPILFKNDERVELQGYCTDIYVDNAIEWMSKQHQEGRPFFAYIPTNAPHGPYHDVPEEPYHRYRDLGMTNEDFPQEEGHPIASPIRPDLTAREYAMIENIDTAIGRLLDALDERDMARNTLVIFMHDNGPQHIRYNAGFRANKGSIREGGVRSPLFMRWPAGLEGGRQVQGVGAHVDIAPTILDACSVTAPEAGRFDGRNLLPMMKGEEEERDRMIVIQAHRGDVPVPWHNAMIRQGDWKLLNDSGFGREIQEGGQPEVRLELYDLANDPWELVDLSSQRSDIVQELKSAYETWFEDVGGNDPRNYEPPRISIGAKSQTRCILTRQDWRGAGWGRRANGHWLVDVVDPGSYEIMVRPCLGEQWPPAREVLLRAGDLTLTRDLSEDGSHCTFQNVDLKPGPLTIAVDVRDDEGTIGAYQVVITREKE